MFPSPSHAPRWSSRRRERWHAVNVSSYRWHGGRAYGCTLVDETGYIATSCAGPHDGPHSLTKPRPGHEWRPSNRVCGRGNANGCKHTYELRAVAWHVGKHAGRSSCLFDVNGGFPVGANSVQTCACNILLGFDRFLRRRQKLRIGYSHAPTCQQVEKAHHTFHTHHTHNPQTGMQLTSGRANQHVFLRV